MRIPIAIAVVTAAAISLATPAQADACADYRLALAAHEAALLLLQDPAREAGFGVRLGLLIEVRRRVLDGQTAVRASLKNEEAAALIDLLLQLEALNKKVDAATADWESSFSSTPKPRFRKVSEIEHAIRNAREAVFREVCQ